MGGQQVGIFPFLLGHRADHRFDPFELGFPLLEHAVIDFVHARDHFHQPPQGAHAFDQAHLLNEIGEVKGGLLQLALHALHIGDLHLLLGLFHQGEHIAHAQDSTGHPLRMEGLEGLHLFAGADELDRGSTHLADRERGPAAAVAIQLGEHRPGETHLLVEGAGEFGGLLADHRIHHQQHLVGGYGGADPHHLLHHRRVDLEPTGGVHDHRVKTLLPALGHPGGGNRLGFLVGAKAEHLHADLAPQGLELIDGSRSIHIGSHQQGPAPLLLQV